MPYSKKAHAAAAIRCHQPKKSTAMKSVPRATACKMAREGTKRKR